MDKYAKLLAKIRNSQANVRYEDLRSLCVRYFGKPRQGGTSHAPFSKRHGAETPE